MEQLVVKRSDGKIVLVDPVGSLEWLYDGTVIILGVIPKKVDVGTVIQNRKIYAMNDNYCIAESITDYEEYVVWNIDHDRCGVNSGRYFKDKMDAELEFASLCFEWIQDNLIIDFEGKD